ncbi:BamA/TamA family outer membrane protein [Mucilaginibacter sp. McL0603]|uniref:BamA/TamA family outer membrane protein n=1 Tax=Mucilaginibacter sp. McL0603 TaxID=3415670 RepID=UPI003CF030F9
MKKILLLISIMLPAILIRAQDTLSIKPITQDSVIVKVHAHYDKVSKVHRFFFGENYRKEWGMDVKLPVIRISELHGGLTPEKQGGGFQTTSIRLVDPTGKEWVLRSVEKDPVKILPLELRQTFARELFIDAMSAQHPFSALVVPPLADAAGIPHATPIIGVVSPDKALGKYLPLLVNKVCLFEEREPTGKSDNTLEAIRNMYDDNDYSFDAKAFLKARCLDVLIGDWDRHDDNWRFTKEKDDKKRIYTPIPRDRDQAMYINQGVIPWVASRDWVGPYLQTFGGKIRDIRYSLVASNWFDRFPYSHITYVEWMKVVNDFCAVETDAVLEAGLRRLPKEAYKLRHDQLLSQLKERRGNLPAAMSWYYYFFNRIVDMHVSNKDEQVNIKDAANNGLTVTINKINKKGNAKDTIFSGTFDPKITREIRFYMGGGNDRIVLDNSSSPIRLKFVDSLDRKNYDIVKSANKVPIYDKSRQNISFRGDSSRARLHISPDSANTTFLPVNLINVWAPLANVQINKDDGFLLGIGFRYLGKEGFRTRPYSTLQELLVTHSFATKAFDVKYQGEWIHALGNADILLRADIKAPNNTINFFGLGNETEFNKTGDYVTYYRTRFNTYQFSPALRWRNEKGLSFAVGPAFQYYHLNPEDNVGRFIDNPSLIHSYDSLTIAKDKVHLGGIATLIGDRRNNKLLPTEGSYLNIKLLSMAGLNSYSRGFTQITGEAAFYVHFADTVITLADRIGGGATFGDAAFYQSLFLGGQGNLLGYKTYRFAGKDMAFNNFEARIKLFSLASYVLPGEFGLSGFFDTGRVWVDNDNSNKWHVGEGGGIYFMPAGLTLFQIIAAHSTEGWYPYFSMLLRF